MNKKNLNANLTYDINSDAMGISLKNRKPIDYNMSECLDDNLILDLNHDGKIIGIEILFTSKYFNIPKTYLKHIKTLNFTIDINKNKILISIKIKFSTRNKLNEKELIFEKLNDEMLTPSFTNLAIA